MNPSIWHTMSTEKVFEVLKTSQDGLSSEEVRQRINEYGPNELKEARKKTPIEMFLEQFKDFMIMVLILSAIVSGFLGDLADTISIIVIVVLNAVIGFVQEYRAEKAMEALKMMAAPSATVLRDGNTSTIASSEVVPGDMVFLEAGRVVPADLRIVESAQLKLEEAALTGESVPVEKHASCLQEEEIPLGDRRNMAYKGTIVSYGRAKGIVIATGMQSELGKIATMLQSEEEVKTPLQKRLTAFGQRLAYIVLVICAIFFGIGVLKGEDPVLMLLTAISLAVAAIPEALPAVATISLAIGAKKMVSQNALIRKLPAVETLGSVTYICSDKTGTLTLNKMTVEEIYVDGKMIQKPEVVALDPKVPLSFENPISPFMIALTLSHDALLNPDGTLIGDPTETALLSVAEKAGFSKKIWEEHYPRVSELPFDSDRKRMTTVHRMPSGDYLSLTKGGLEVLLDRCVNVLQSSGTKPIHREELVRESDRMAADGLRILALAMRIHSSLPESIDSESFEKELTLLGFVGIMDPPREEAKEAVALCKSAGIKPVMITGDHPITARAIAKRIGIIENDEEVITGKYLEKLPLEEFEKKVESIRVYARVAPEQKLKIVKALQDKGQFVAMTGDGVNDAPALKRADIGVAMGINGTDVSKEAAHMILLDDNFATIVKAVKEGRKIYDNIKKFIKYTMTSNLGEIVAIVCAPFFGLPIPLLPIHILWINLVTDGLPGLAFAAEPAEKGTMNRPPKHPEESIFAHGLAAHILWVGALMGLTTIFMQAYAISMSDMHWQTMAFTVLCLSQMGHALAIRSEKESLLTLGLFSNKYLLGAIFLTFILQMATIYLPVLQPIFRTEALTLNELGLTLVFSSVVFFAVEIEKFFKRRKSRN